MECIKNSLVGAVGLLKKLSFMLISLVWLGACVEAAKAVPTVDPVAQAVAKYTVPGFSPEDVGFVRSAYLEYQNSVKSQSELTKMVETVRSLVFYEPNIMYYCNTLLSRFYRSQLDAMAQAAPVQFTILKEAIRVACEKIDEIGALFIRAVEINSMPVVKGFIDLLQYNKTLQIALNAKNKRGDTALMSACRNGNVEIVKMLLSLKDASGKVVVDVNAVNNDGNTALLLASRLIVVQLLLEHGANILYLNNQGQSVLDSLNTKLVDATISDSDKAKIRSILKVFNAVKPGLTTQKLKGMLPEARVLKEAYVEFQQGNHQQLRNVLFEMPIIYAQLMQQADSLRRMATALEELFKKESIRPLFMFLINNLKERELANNYLKFLGLPVIKIAKFTCC